MWDVVAYLVAYPRDSSYDGEEDEEGKEV